MTTLPLFHGNAWKGPYPEKIKVGQSVLTAKGQGLFPYDCISKDEHPNAMIYTNETDLVWDFLDNGE